MRVLDLATGRGEPALRVAQRVEVSIPVIEAAAGAGIVVWVHDIVLGRLAADLSEDQEAAWEAELAREAEVLRVGPMIRLGGVTRLVVGRSTR
jgi:hypothetical protein